MKQFILFISLSYISCANLCHAQGYDINFGLTKGDKIEDLMLHHTQFFDFNGSVLVAEKGEIIYENTFGYAQVEKEEPFDAQTAVYLASLAKPFTALAVMILEEQGKISYSDPVTKYMPILPKGYKNVQIRHLLNHTAGVPDYFRMGLALEGLNNNDVIKELLIEKHLDFHPGTKYRYSNSGYVLLAMVVQVASGQMFDEFMNDHIFSVAKMEHTFIKTEDSDKNAVVANGYDKKHNLDDYKLLTYGDGGMYSTTNDLFKWQKALRGGQFIKTETFNKAIELTTLSNGKEIRYGYGWNLGDILKGRTIYHTGGLAGFRTYFEHQLAENNVLIILSNTSNNHLSEMRNILVKILDEREYQLPEPN